MTTITDERLAEILDGTGWVFWNPDSGEEYSADHPIESGICEDAERIRQSTRQEDLLHGAMQVYYTELQSLRSQAGVSEDSSDKAAIEIADAVLSWMVKHDLLDADQEYHDDDIIEVLNDLHHAPIEITEEMVERAAIGIYNEGPSIGQDCECGWKDQTPQYKQKARMIARAALTAALQGETK